MVYLEKISKTIAIIVILFHKVLSYDAFSICFPASLPPLGVDDKLRAVVNCIVSRRRSNRNSCAHVQDTSKLIYSWKSVLYDNTLLCRDDDERV